MGIRVVVDDVVKFVYCSVVVFNGVVYVYIEDVGSYVKKVFGEGVWLNIEFDFYV